MKKYRLLFTVTVLLYCTCGFSQNIRTVTWTTITDENKVPAYTLPDPLMCLDGHSVTSVLEWEQLRRPELVNILTEYMYGKAPSVGNLGYEVKSTDNKAYGGVATKKIVKIFLTPSGSDGVSVDAVVCTPNSAKSANPAFLVIGNMREPDVLRLLENGYAAVWYDPTTAAPDNKDSYMSGLLSAYFKPGQTCPLPNEWRTISAWAWMASRILDYLEKDSSIDAAKVAIHGHSRLGKTALWAGALDERFALVIPAGSGCCGVALSRRMYGETVFDANVVFPHWFCGNYQQFSLHEDTMPFDQHEVVALCAPRPVLIATAEDDQWGDPRGEYLSGRAASPVYALYGLPGLVSETMPAVDNPDQRGKIAYHIRKGGHAVTDYDWEQFIKFADKCLK